MKAKVKETGEIIEVHSLYPVTYSRLDCNGQIREEYDFDELEFEPGPTMVSLEKICEYLHDKLYTRVNGAEHYVASKDKIVLTEFVRNLREAFGG